VLAVVSCQLYGGGLFNALDALARLPRVDAVLHLGDYIYEYGAGGYGAGTEKRLRREPDPPHEIVTLSDYRRRHAQYKSDPDLQAAHARAAFICVWDDHEIANDCWVNGAENHDAGEGAWLARKAVALQAYHEWMPIRTPARAGRGGVGLDAIYRRFDFGDLATLLMTETRLLGRAEQAAFKAAAIGPDEVRAVLAERARPDREMLGATQARWLEAQLRSSVDAGRPWQVIGNQLIMARVAGPEIEKTAGADRTAAVLARLPESLRQRIQGAQATYRAGVPMNLDAWDGYPHARERLYASFRRAGSHPIVLSGDSHSFWANQLADDAGRPVAKEFGTSSVTSPSWGDALPGLDLGGAIAARNEEVLFSDQERKGFVVLTLTRAEARADFHAVSTVLAKPFQSGAFKAFRISERDRVLREA
jgi:alkaline phosphatase D